MLSSSFFLWSEQKENLLWSSFVRNWFSMLLGFFPFFFLVFYFEFWWIHFWLGNSMFCLYCQLGESYVIQFICFLSVRKPFRYVSPADLWKFYKGGQRYWGHGHKKTFERYRILGYECGIMLFLFNYFWKHLSACLSFLSISCKLCSQKIIALAPLHYWCHVKQLDLGLKLYDWTRQNPIVPNVYTTTNFWYSIGVGYWANRVIKL